MNHSSQPYQSHPQPFSRSQPPGAPGQHAQGDAAYPRVESLLERLTAVFLTLDHTWRVTYVSHQPDPLLAQLRITLLGKTFWDVFPEAVDAPFFGAYHQALEAAHAVQREEYSPSLHKWFEIYIIACPQGWEVSLHDITRRKHAEEALVAAAAIIESSEDAICSHTLDGIILSWNGAGECLFGYRASEMIGQPASTLVPTDRHQEWQESMRLLHAGERMDRFETVRIRKDGSPVEVSVTISPLKDATGQLIGASTSARGITQRKLIERQLSRSEQRFRALIEQSTDAILLVDVQGRILYTSPSVQSLLGYGPEELLGCNAFELVHLDDRETLTALLDSVLEHGRMH